MSKDQEQKTHDALERDSDDSNSLELKDSLAALTDNINSSASEQLKLAMIEAIKDATLSGKSLYLTELRSSCMHDSEVAKDEIVNNFSRAIENTELEVVTQYTSKRQNESENSIELNKIFTQLHDADQYIAETRQNTVRLGTETRSMLDDLRKQLG